MTALLLSLVVVAAPPEENQAIKLLATFDTKGKGAAGPCVSVTPDGKWLTAGVTIEGEWKYIVGDIMAGTWKTMDAIDFSPMFLVDSGKHLACGYGTWKDKERGIVFLSFPELKVTSRFPGRFLHAVAPNGTLTLAESFDKKGFRSGQDSKFELWDWKINKVLHTLDIGKYNQVVSGSFRRDGKQCVVHVRRGNRAAEPPGLPPDPPHNLLFDTATGKQIARIDGYEWCSAIAPDGKTVAVAGTLPPRGFLDRHTIAFWDAETKRLATPVKHPGVFRGELYGMHYLPDGRHLVVVGAYGVYLWDLQTEDLVEADKAPSKPLGKVEVSFTPTPDGVLVATLRYNGVAQVWKVTAPAKKKQ